MPDSPKTHDYPFLGIPPYYGYRILIWMINHLPEPLVYFLARRLADCRRLSDAPGRNAVMQNLRIILGDDVPEKKLKWMTKQVFYQTGAYLAEFLGQKRFAPRFKTREYSTIEGRENLDGPLKEGRGVLIISAHYSNWELGAAVVAARDYDVYVTSLQHEDPRVDRLFNELRAVWGYSHMPINESVRRTIDVLNEGKVTCYLGDRSFGTGTVEVDFFGRKEELPVIPARMAVKTGAAYVPGVVYRKGRNHFEVRLFPEIIPPEGVPEKEAAADMVQQYARFLEERIREAPTQWIRYTVIGEGAVPAAGDTSGGNRTESTGDAEGKGPDNAGGGTGGEEQG